MIRRDLYVKNCKPTMIHSRKTCQKINAKDTFRSVRQFALKAVDGINAGFQPANAQFAYAA